MVPDDCVWGLACIQGQCTSPEAAGQSCADNDDCDYLGGFVCGGACIPQPLAPAGQPCGFSGLANVTIFCDASGLCNSNGTCQPAAGDGAPCDALTGPNCLPPAQCIASVCTLLGPSCR
jgi:hypothetical protein